MHTFVIISYPLLWGLVVLEAAMLRKALRSTVRFKRLYFRSDRRIEVGGPPRGAPAPDFSGPLLENGETLTAAQLKGEPTILLFVSPNEASLPGYRPLAAAIHALWHRVEGHLYVVCSGTEETCRQLAPTLHVHGLAENQLPVILDEESRITRSFQIGATPSAVELDENLWVTRYGRPIPEPAEQKLEEEAKPIAAIDW